MNKQGKTKEKKLKNRRQSFVSTNLGGGLVLFSDSPALHNVIATQP